MKNTGRLHHFEDLVLPFLPSQLLSHLKCPFFTLAKVTHNWSTIMDKPLCTLQHFFSSLFPGCWCGSRKWSFLCITPVGGLQWWVKASGLTNGSLGAETQTASFFFPPLLLLHSLIVPFLSSCQFMFVRFLHTGHFHSSPPLQSIQKA